MAQENPSEHVRPGVDASRPSPARLYDCYLGGTHNLAVDRELGDYVGVWVRRP